MRGKGIRYDTGFVNRGVSTHLGRTYPDMAWEPKAACTALADYYRGCSHRCANGQGACTAGAARSATASRH
jgi:hypothetical protein